MLSASIQTVTSMPFISTVGITRFGTVFLMEQIGIQSKSRIVDKHTAGMFTWSLMRTMNFMQPIQQTPHGLKRLCTCTMMEHIGQAKKSLQTLTLVLLASLWIRTIIRIFPMLQKVISAEMGLSLRLLTERVGEINTWRQAVIVVVSLLL